MHNKLKSSKCLLSNHLVGRLISGLVWLVGRLVRLVGRLVGRPVGGGSVSGSHSGKGKKGNEGLKRFSN